MKKLKGTALLIAILLVTAIGTIAFSFGRIMALEIDNAAIYENGISAYYAAESGVEEGLLRYRYSASAAVPFEDWTLNQNKVLRTDLSAKQMVSTTDDGIARTIDILAPLKQIYDLRLGYLGSEGKSKFTPFYGQDANQDGNFDLNDLRSANYAASADSPFYLQKDESLKFNYSKNLDISASKPLVLMVNFINPAGATFIPENALMEIKATVKRPTLPRPQEYKKMLAFERPTGKNSGVHGGKINDYFSDIFVPGSETLVYANNLLADLGVPVEPGMEITLALKPLYYDVKIGLATSGCLLNYAMNLNCTMKADSVLSGPYTTINSTGYYGGATRTIEAKINRQSGTLYDLFDYVVYTAN